MTFRQANRHLRLLIRRARLAPPAIGIVVGAVATIVMSAAGSGLAVPWGIELAGLTILGGTLTRSWRGSDIDDALRVLVANQRRHSDPIDRSMQSGDFESALAQLALSRASGPIEEYERARQAVSIDLWRNVRTDSVDLEPLDQAAMNLPPEARLRAHLDVALLHALVETSATGPFVRKLSALTPYLDPGEVTLGGRFPSIGLIVTSALLVLTSLFFLFHPGA